MADRVGQQLGNYRLVRLLGKGGFAEVYLGEHLRLKTQAAIKVLHTSLEDEDVEGFLREAQTVARLKHPHIVRVFDFDVENHTPFLVMDYLPNGNVRRSHPKGIPLPLTTIVSYVKQVASALQYAHDEKLIHRDIKPENMLLDKGDTIVLSDFGIALMAQSSRYQSTQEVAGTAAYMAPEQFQGKPRRASDQYALGVVVYEWLTGDRPFHGSFSEIASQHMFVLPPPLHEKVPNISPEVEEVVLTALEKEPHKRFGSVQAFATALEQAHQIVPARSVVPTPGITSPRQTPLSPDVVTPITPVQSSQPMNAVTPQGQSSQSNDAITPSSAPAVMYPSTSESVLSNESQASKQGISRRGLLVGLIGLAVTGGGITWLVLSQKPQVRTIPSQAVPLGTTLYSYRGHLEAVFAVAWSPNGQRIASASGDHTVQVWDAATGKKALSYNGHSSNVWAVAWSPDGKRIASASGDKTVQVWDATSGNSLFTYRGHSGSVYTLTWSPNGQRIASGGNDYTVQVWDSITGIRLLTYRSHPGAVNAVAWSPNGQRIASGSAHDYPYPPRCLQVWDAASGGNVLIYSGHNCDYSGAVNAVAWSPNGQRIASGSDDLTVQVWDAASGGNVLIYPGHAGGVTTVAWSPDGQRIASGGNDYTVQIWNASYGSNVSIYRGHAGSVTALAWSPDGRRIASASADKTVQIWQAV